MFRKFTLPALFLMLCFLINSANATKMKSFWKNPSATAASMQLKNVLVVVTIKQPMTRKVAEDKACKIIKAGGKADATPSYSVIGDEDLENVEKAKAKVAEMGFDGVIIMRYAGSKDETKYDPESGDQSSSTWTIYNDFWGAWGAAWGATYNAQTTNDLKIYIETMFFSMKENKLVWAGITETKNPKNAAEVVADIAEETAKTLRDQGLIAGKK